MALLKPSLQEAASVQQFDAGDFDLYLEHHSLELLVREGIDALVERVVRDKEIGQLDTLNPLVWLAQYLMRHHPRKGGALKSSMERTEIIAKQRLKAGIEEGRRVLRRRRANAEKVFKSWVLSEKASSYWLYLDADWALEGKLEAVFRDTQIQEIHDFSIIWEKMMKLADRPAGALARTEFLEADKRREKRLLKEAESTRQDAEEALARTRMLAARETIDSFLKTEQALREDERLGESLDLGGWIFPSIIYLLN